jgi:hypothetical protein
LTSAATLYATRRLDLGVLRVAFRGTRVLEGAGGQWAELERDGCRLTLTQLEDADAADHVAGVRTFVSERGEVLDPSFLTAVAAVVQVIRLNATTPTTTEPVRGWLAQLLALAAGFWFDGTTFRDPGGRALAASVVPVSRARSPSGASAAPVIDDDGDGTTDVGSAGTGRFTEPPDALRVLHRAWALCALASRARLEGLPAAMAGARAATIVGWMRSRGVEAELEPDERELLEAAPGELARDARVDASWRGDGAGVLAWALGVTPQPDYQVATDLDTVAGALGFLGGELPEPLRPPRLRSSSELEWLARRLLAVHWRLREFWLNPGPVDFRAFAQQAWFGRFDLVGFKLVRDDLAIDGVGLSEAPRDAIKRCHGVAVERHQAIGWLRGAHRLYSKVDTST